MSERSESNAMTCSLTRYCLYDNPDTFRREWWDNGEVRYSVCVSVIKSKRVPPNFHSSWKRPWVTNSFEGSLLHLGLAERSKADNGDVEPPR